MCDVTPLSYSLKTGFEFLAWSTAIVNAAPLVNSHLFTPERSYQREVFRSLNTNKKDIIKVHIIMQYLKPSDNLRKRQSKTVRL